MPSRSDTLVTCPARRRCEFTINAERQRMVSMQLELSNRVLDFMLVAKCGDKGVQHPSRIARTSPNATKRKRVYKPFLVRLDELLADGRVSWKTESIFAVTKSTVLLHFSDLSKPTYAFKRAMKSHGFTLDERSTNKLFYFEHKNFKKSSRGMLSEFSTIMWGVNRILVIESIEPRCPTIHFSLPFI